MIVKGSRRFPNNNCYVPGHHRQQRRYFLNQTASVFVDPIVVSGSGAPYDSFEWYGSNQPLNGLNGGWSWAGPYIDKTNYMGIQVLDTMDTYISASLLNGKSDGAGWAGAYVDRDTPYNYTLFLDTFESYTSGSALNGLNGGTGSTQPYVDR